MRKCINYREFRCVVKNREKNQLNTITRRLQHNFDKDGLKMRVKSRKKKFKHMPLRAIFKKVELIRLFAN